VATYGGRPRNPVLIAREYFDEASAYARGDVGAREFLRARSDIVVPVACDDVADPGDIDTPEDLRRYGGSR
jgi:nicotine blue oxidoreductase